MFERVVLIHYHEIGLKGRNRGAFERKLQENLVAALGEVARGGVERIASRLLIPVRTGDVETALYAAARTPGVVHASDAYVASRDPVEMERAAVAAVVAASAADPGVRSFAVDSRRSATDYAERSLDMNRRIGERVRRETGLVVDLDVPDITCRVEVVQAKTLVSVRRVEGPGGLPVGTSGRVVALLSAGIDSPVAVWRMMRRGAVVIAVHFSGRPQSDARSEHLVREIAEVLAGWGGVGRLYIVPFGDLQREVALSVPADLRVLIYRRLMVRIAEAIAEGERAKALVTGESLGQVASQTLDNIAVVDAVADLPVLRPLVGSDKQEIISEARRLGTFALSTRPHEDCCTLFMPRSPETHGTVRQAEDGESGLDVARMVSDALAGLSWIDFPCPSYRPPGARPRTEVSGT